MERWMTWIADQDPRGWACSHCNWSYPLPALLGDPEAKNAYDRLARARFESHDCSKHPKPEAQTGGETFTDRVRKFVLRGYKPKDAVELILQEVMLEYRNQPKVVEKARADAEEFLRNLREGRI